MRTVHLQTVHASVATTRYCFGGGPQVNKFEHFSNPLATRCRSWGSMSAGRRGVVQGLTSGGFGPELGGGDCTVRSRTSWVIITWGPPWTDRMTDTRDWKYYLPTNPLSFFFLIFGGHESFLWDHWYPYFGLLVTSPLGFKARVGSALFKLSGGVRVMLHIALDLPLVQHLPTSWQPAWQLSHLFHIPARHWWDSKPGAIMPPLTVWDQAGQMLYWLSHPGSAYPLLLLKYLLNWFFPWILPKKVLHVKRSFSCK